VNTNRAIVTAAIDYGDVFEYTEPYLCQYAKKVCADLHILNSREITEGTDHSLKWETLYAHEMLEDYNRVMWIDADCYVKPSCPDIFEVSKDGMFNGVQYGHELLGKYEGMVHQLHSNMGNIPRPMIFLNTGVFVLDEQTQWVIDPNGYEVAPDDQHLINLRLNKARRDDVKVTTNTLPPEFNGCNLLLNNTDLTEGDSHIIHFTGKHTERQVREFFDPTHG
jgi:hypothetical protein